MAGAYFSQVMENLMKKIIKYLSLAFLVFSIVSCSNSEDSSGTNKELDVVLDQPNSTDKRNYLDLPKIPSNNCYYIDRSTIDNSTIDNSSISNNATILHSVTTNCAAVSDSTIILSRIDNSTVSNSNVDNDSVVKNGSYICIESSIDNSTIDNATICNGSTVDVGSTVNDGSSVRDNTTVTNGSSVTNGSTVCNSTIDNSTIDNSSVCTGASMSFVGRIIRDSIVSDTDAPNITRVDGISNSSNFNTASNLALYVNFSECITLDNSSGNPSLLLETGSGTNDRYATWYRTECNGGVGSVYFEYNVQASDDTCDLDYKSVNSFELNGGTIRDNSTNNAVLTLPSPGANGSLGRNAEMTLNDDKGRC